MAKHSYLTQETQATIVEEAKKALAEIDLIEPPVPFAVLYESQQLSATKFSPDDPGYIELVGKIGADADSLRGCIFVPDRQVITRDDGYEARNNFVLAHEFGHWKLPWHQALLYQCTQFDLSAAANKQLEREANFFASELCFMGEQFTERLFGSELNIRHLIKLAGEFGMSKEATFRRAAELEHRPCMLLRMTRLKPGADDEVLKIDYIISSGSFEAQYGTIDHTQTFSKEHIIAQIVHDPLAAFSNTFEGKIRMRRTGAMLKLEGWKNNWNVFALCTPLPKDTSVKG